MICPYCAIKHKTPLLLTRLNVDKPLDLSKPAFACPCCEFTASLDLRMLTEDGRHTRPDELRPCPCGQRPDRPGGNQ